MVLVEMENWKNSIGRQYKYKYVEWFSRMRFYIVDSRSL